MKKYNSHERSEMPVSVSTKRTSLGIIRGQIVMNFISVCEKRKPEIDSIIDSIRLYDVFPDLINMTKTSDPNDLTFIELIEVGQTSEALSLLVDYHLQLMKDQFVQLSIDERLTLDEMLYTESCMIKLEYLLMSFMSE